MLNKYSTILGLWPECCCSIKAHLFLAAIIYSINNPNNLMLMLRLNHNIILMLSFHIKCVLPQVFWNLPLTFWFSSSILFLLLLCGFLKSHILWAVYKLKDFSWSESMKLFLVKQGLKTLTCSFTTQLLKWKVSTLAKKFKSEFWLQKQKFVFSGARFKDTAGFSE